MPAGQTLLPWSPGRSFTRQETYKWPQSQRQTLCLIPHKQTPPHPQQHTPTHTHHLPPLCVFSPAAQLRIPRSHWPDSCSLTTPPRPDRLAAVPFPGWPRAEHSGRRSPEVSFDRLCSRSCGLRVPAPPVPTAPSVSKPVLT